ncbi:FtsJ-like methyltransferase-domain-containing protein [Chytriomyces sp. MP71]|nr:FtsJ-like methyltransferase-domain-containing protein [Chytriomyces sp. MP71]
MLDGAMFFAVFRIVGLRGYSTTSTKQWVQRQTSDHFVKQAHRQSLRSRASFKLLELLRAHPQLIRKGSKVLDLGAAPGGWTQVAVAAVSAQGAGYLMKGGRFVDAGGVAERFSHEEEGLFDGDEVGENVATMAPVLAETGGRVVAVDLLPIDPIYGADILMGDMMKQETQNRVVELCGGKVDTVLSDMAHSFTGSRTADVVRVIDLCKTAFLVAERVLKTKGHFVCKFIRGEDDDELQQMLKTRFETVAFDKPMASRSESAEAYLICLEYNGKIAPEPVRNETASAIQQSLSSQNTHLGPKINPRSSRPTLLNEIDTKPRSKPPPIPHWSLLKPGTRVRAILVTDLSGKPIGKGVSNAGKEKAVEGVVEVLLSRDYHRSGVKVRLADGRIGRACEILG